jgi:hypothetical protein
VAELSHSSTSMLLARAAFYRSFARSHRMRRAPPYMRRPHPSVNTESIRVSSTIRRMETMLDGIA